MSGLYECASCGNYLTHSKKFEEALEVGCTEKGFYIAKEICDCGDVRLSGGENYCDGVDRGIIMIGGNPKNYSTEEIDNMDVFEAEMLEECEESESEFSTVEGTIYTESTRMVHLKRKEPR